MATTPQPIPMFGAWNEHYFNHPAGLPVSKYKPNTNPNTGAASVDAAWNAARQAASTSTGTTPPASTNTGTGGTQTPPASTGSGTAQTPAPGTTPTTGFASKYSPAMMQQLYENPWYVLPDVFSGISTSSPLYQQMRDIGADPLALYNLSRGGQGQLTGGPADFTNWLGAMYQGLGTAGGSGFTAQNLLQQLFNPQPNSSLAQILSAGDMGTQVRTLFNLARDATNVGMNPISARAYQASLARAGDEYANKQLSAPAGQSMSPLEWIRQNMPYLAMGGS